MNITQVADELYALKPSEFTAARNDHARRARGSGDRELAEAISRLRRPTVSAWLVNSLTRQAADLVESVMELGEALREAQHAMAGDRLRELSPRRRELLGKLAQEARRVAARSGQQLGAEAEREVMRTFEAALVDPRAADAVRSGHLSGPLSYAGLGAADLDDAVEEPVSLLEWARTRGRGTTTKGHAGREPAEPGTAGQAGGKPPEAQAPRKTQRPREARAPGRTRAPGKTRAPRETQAGRETAGGRAERQTARGRAGQQAAERDALAARRKAREAADAEAELHAAGEEVRQAETVLADAERRVSRARGDQQAIRQRIEELEQRLEQATAQESQSLAALRQARQSRDAASRSLAASQRRLARAKAKAGRDVHLAWLREPVVPARVGNDLGLHLMRFAMMEGRLTRGEVLAFLDSLASALSGFVTGVEKYVASGTQTSQHALLALEHGIAVHRASLAWARSAIKALTGPAQPGG